MKKIAAILVTAVLAGSCATAPKSDLPERKVYKFDCGSGFELTADIDRAKKEAVVFLPGKQVRLKSVPTASGEKFAGEGVVFWTKDGSAALKSDMIDMDCTAVEEKETPGSGGEEAGEK